MKKTKVLLVAIATLVLSACATTNENPDAGNGGNTDQGGDTVTKLEGFDKILSPKGAPALAFYDKFDNDKFVAEDPENVVPQLSLKNYGMIVMDFFGGAMNVKKAQSEYKIARMLTAGNLFLVNITGKTELPTADSVVLTFGPSDAKQNLPTLALKAAYPEINDSNIYTAGKKASDLPPVIRDGKIEGKTIDFALVPQPVLHKISAMPKVKIISYLNDAIEAKTGLDYIPQAALFVHQTMYDQNKAYFDEQFGIIDENINNAISDPSRVAEAENAKIPADIQAAKVGITADAIVPVQTGNPQTDGTLKYKTTNGFGFVAKEETLGMEQINTFLTKIGKPAFTADMFLTK